MGTRIGIFGFLGVIAGLFLSFKFGMPIITTTIVSIIVGLVFGMILDKVSAPKTSGEDQ